MRVLAWNIRHGGGAAQSLAPAIMAHEPDVVVLSEYREKTAALTEQLRFFGWSHSVASPVAGDTNGVAIVSQHPLEVHLSPFGDPPFSWWGVEASIDDLIIIGVYAPLVTTLGSSQIQRDFWNVAHRVIELRRRDRVLLVGDYNTCARSVDGPTPQPCWDAFEHLRNIGWTDAWRAVNPGANDYSWVNRGANPPTHYRLDHAFVSPLLAGAVTSRRYSHAERELGLSDHSPLILELQ